MIEVTVYHADDGWRWRARSKPGNEEILTGCWAYQTKTGAVEEVELLFGKREPVNLVVYSGREAKSQMAGDVTRRELR